MAERAHGSGETRQRYLRAAAVYAEILAKVPADAWEKPGLGVWSVRDLVGHTVGSAFDAVVASASQPAPERHVDSPEGYYALAKKVDPQVYQSLVAASVEAARRDGAALGDQPASAVRGKIAEVTAALEKVGDDDLIVSPGGGMRVADWLATRVFELVVHGLDLAAAVGVPAGMPDELVADTASLAARIGAAGGDGLTVLLGLTGRQALPANFSVV